MICVVDYCKGNLKSVERGLRYVGADASISDDPSVIACADGIVLPGVGAFADASQTMIATGQMDAIKNAIERGVPFLGICLGVHLLFENGIEGAPSPDDLPQGLGIIPGTVGALPRVSADGIAFKIPHVGWNTVDFASADAGPLFANIPNGEWFYFTHSYCSPQNAYTIATTTHSETFPSAVQKGDTIFGVQFHPEKSSDVGSQLLANFADIVTRALNERPRHGFTSCN